jgi:lipopolysaccharide transport system permease protein
LWRVTCSDLAARYAGSGLGMVLAIIYPLTVLGAYLLVYGLILGVRVPGLSSTEYVLYVFAGLVPFLTTSEAIFQGIGSVVANKHLLRNTMFPIPLVPVKAVLSSQSTMATGFGVILVTAAVTGRLQPTLVMLPVLWLVHAVALCGVVWILSVANVFMRDLQTLCGAGLLVLMIASPIAYAPGMVPDALRPVLVLNPFASLVVAYQQVIVLGVWPGALTLAALVLGAAALFAAGAWIFARVQTVLIEHV